jgi:hypothetical protein
MLVAGGTGWVYGTCQEQLLDVRAHGPLHPLKYSSTSASPVFISLALDLPGIGHLCDTQLLRLCVTLADA